MFVCQRCGNNDPKYIAFLKGKPYCRMCIVFKGKQATNSVLSNKATLNLDFKLSYDQKEVSYKLAAARKEKKNAFLYAVTGAGKTELVYQAIYETLLEKKKVGFVAPRKDVVIDLFPRIQTAFNNSKVTAVYGNHTSVLEGDIIILTTHQLYRYNHYFDYLVFDEIDAFPYKGNKVLHSFFMKSIKGNYALMSATPDEKMIEDIKKQNGIYVELLRRYHNVDLPVPKIKSYTFTLLPFLIKKLKEFQKGNKQCFIFVPTIAKAELLFSFIKFFVPNGNVVHSKKEERERIIKDFKENKYSYLITTSILERGVTVKNLQVVIFNADHNLYDSNSLIQISGRVGRKIDAPTGEVWFLCYKKTTSMLEAINKINKVNLCHSA